MNDVIIEFLSIEDFEFSFIVNDDLISVGNLIIGFSVEVGFVEDDV